MTYKLYWQTGVHVHQGADEAGVIPARETFAEYATVEDALLQAVVDATVHGIEVLRIEDSDGATVFAAPTLAKATRAYRKHLDAAFETGFSNSQPRDQAKALADAIEATGHP